jgi:hypothetical protein
MYINMILRLSLPFRPLGLNVNALGDGGKVAIWLRFHKVLSFF